MTRTVRNNPPRSQPRDTHHHRSREVGGGSRASGNFSHPINASRPAHALEQTADTQAATAPRSASRSPGAASAAGLLTPRQRGRRYARETMRELQEHLRDLAHLHDEREASPELPEPEELPRRVRNRRRPVVLREAAWADSDHQAPERDFFEQAGDEYRASVEIDVGVNMDESVAAMRAVIQEIMQRPDTGPGLVPDDIVLMERGVYAAPAMALVNVLPTLCIRRGNTCGLRLFDERHMRPDPRREGRVLQHVFEACVQLCDSHDRRILAVQIQALVPRLLQHIDEDTQPEPGPLLQLLRQVYAAVHLVRGALLSEVLRVASEGLSQDAESD